MIQRPKSSLSFRFSTFVLLNTWCPYRLYNKKLCNFLKWSIFYPFSIIHLLPLKLLDPHYWWLCGTNTHAEPKSNERNADGGNRNPKKGKKKEYLIKAWKVEECVFPLSLPLSLVCSHRYQPQCVFLNESTVNHGVTLAEDSVYPPALPHGACTFALCGDHQGCCHGRWLSPMCGCVGSASTMLQLMLKGREL